MEVPQWNSVFSVAGLDTSHQSAREMTQRSGYQHQPPPQANKRCSVACHQVVCRWIWMHSLSGICLLMEIDEQTYAAFGEKRKVNVLMANVRTLKCCGYGRIKLDIVIISHLKTASLLPQLQPMHFIGTISKYGASRPSPLSIEPYNTQEAYWVGDIGLRLHTGGVQPTLGRSAESHAMWKTYIHLWSQNHYLDMTVIWKKVSD